MNPMNSNESPPDEEPLARKKSFGWPFWLFLTVTLVVLAGLTAPMVIRCKKKPEQTGATSNLRQIGLALFEFETEYGAFPNDKTSAMVAKTHPDHGYDLSGTSSNALFRQLFAAGITRSEQMFYAQIDGTKKPDGDFDKGESLDPGEVAFGYIAGLSTAGNPARVVAFCPIIPGTDRFDPKPFEGKAVVLRVDNSVASLNIDENGHAIVFGSNLLSSENELWNGKPLDIRYPEFPPASKPSFFQKLFSK